MQKKNALVAMSGGVDSAAAVLLTREAGYDPIGVTMLLHRYSDTDAEIARARASADRLGIPHYVCDKTEAFEREVIRPFVKEYENGRTPNPCLRCNRYLKFEALLALADELSCEVLVTGHYARVEYDGERGRHLLKRARCREKDQSYYLYSLPKEILSRIYFPLGEVASKEEIRALASRHALPAATSRDSQDICFVPNGDYAEFIRSFTKTDYPCGNFLDTAGNILGTHRGILHYTVGQRKGLGIALGEPMYVKEKSAESNTVTLARDEELFASTLLINEVNLLDRDAITEPIRAFVKHRCRAKEAPATVYPLEDGKLRVVFDMPQRAITPGQAAVLYDNDTVIGGGIIA